MNGNKLTMSSHNIVVEDRSHIKITGVEEVDSYNDNTIVLSTIKGGMSIKGEDLNISRLNLDDGSLKITGLINSLVYISKEGEPKTILAKIFK